MPGAPVLDPPLQEGVLRTDFNPYLHGNSYIREVCNWTVLTATLEKLRLYM